jgi:hypothetical protein
MVRPEYVKTDNIKIDNIKINIKPTIIEPIIIIDSLIPIRIQKNPEDPNPPLVYN